MKFIQHYSSSMGNLYEIIGSGNKRLLLDPGVTWKQICKAINYDLKNIVGALSSHRHKDHCKGIPSIIEAGIDVYINEDTYHKLTLKQHYGIYITKPEIYLTIETFKILTFPLIHDVPALGFLIHDMNTGECCLFCPDTGYIKQRFDIRYTIVMLECSYSHEILYQRVKTGDINEEVAKRIVKNHTEINTVLDYLQKYCDLTNCREIHLLHCSGQNIDKKQTKEMFEKKLFIKTIVKGVTP